MNVSASLYSLLISSRKSASQWQTGRTAGETAHPELFAGLSIKSPPGWSSVPRPWESLKAAAARPFFDLFTLRLQLKGRSELRRDVADICCQVSKHLAEFLDMASTEHRKAIRQDFATHPQLRGTFNRLVVNGPCRYMSFRKALDMHCPSIGHRQTF
jgi:hypothetical protein